MLIENYDRIFWWKNIEEHGETCHSRSDLGGESDNIYIFTPAKVTFMKFILMKNFRQYCY